MNAAVAAAAVVVRRTIAAPAEDIFDAWLDPEALGAWMRPGTIKSTVAKIDARVGGRYEIVMQGESGAMPPTTGIYVVIDRPKRLVFTWQAQYAGSSETLVTVDFLRVAQGTEVVVTHEQLPEAARDAHQRGWLGGLEHLAGFCAQPQRPRSQP